MWPNSQIAADDGARSLNSGFGGRERRLLAFRFARSSAALLRRLAREVSSCSSSWRMCVRFEIFVYIFFFVFCLSVSGWPRCPSLRIDKLTTFEHVLMQHVFFLHVTLHRLARKITSKPSSRNHPTYFVSCRGAGSVSFIIWPCLLQRAALRSVYTRRFGQ